MNSFIIHCSPAKAVKTGRILCAFVGRLGPAAVSTGGSHFELLMYLGEDPSPFFPSRLGHMPFQDQKCCCVVSFSLNFFLLRTPRVKNSLWSSATQNHFHTPATKIYQLFARRVGTLSSQEPTIPNYLTPGASFAAELEMLPF